ncbi:hypothetical protein LCGC14_2780690 [marine sediment metagenome]|uniref:Uncharacterized protein n=1 Tax=marine sediment metagenome TaxID=412755 RepID=A0A0F9BJW9_9ZZZZ
MGWSGAIVSARAVRTNKAPHIETMLGAGNVDAISIMPAVRKEIDIAMFIVSFMGSSSILL